MSTTHSTAAGSPSLSTTHSTAAGSPSLSTSHSTAAGSSSLPTSHSTATGSPSLSTTHSTATGSPSLSTTHSTATGSPSLSTTHSTATGSPSLSTSHSTATGSPSLSTSHSASVSLYHDSSVSITPLITGDGTSCLPSSSTSQASTINQSDAVKQTIPVSDCQLYHTDRLIIVEKPEEWNDAVLIMEIEDTLDLRETAEFTLQSHSTGTVLLFTKCYSEPGI